MNTTELRAWIEDTVGNLVMTAGIAKAKGDKDMGDGFALAAKTLDAVDTDCDRETLLTRLGACGATIELNAATMKRRPEKEISDFGYGYGTVVDSIADRIAAERVN